MNEQVLCDVEWSCDMCVVWLQSRAAAELTPRMWTRSVFDLRRSSVDVAQRDGKKPQSTKIVVEMLS